MRHGSDSYRPLSMPLNTGSGMGHVLVLNASYEPLNITTWRRAMVMLLKGKAEGLEHDPSRSIRGDCLLPTVIRLRQFVRVPYRQMPLTRRNVFHRDGHRCQYCGYSGEPLSIDHVIPRSRGGADVWENVTTAIRAVVAANERRRALAFAAMAPLSTSTQARMRPN